MYLWAAGSITSGNAQLQKIQPEQRNTFSLLTPWNINSNWSPNQRPINTYRKKAQSCGTIRSKIAVMSLVVQFTCYLPKFHVSFFNTSQAHYPTVLYLEQKNSAAIKIFGEHLIMCSFWNIKIKFSRERIITWNIDTYINMELLHHLGFYFLPYKDTSLHHHFVAALETREEIRSSKSRVFKLGTCLCKYVSTYVYEQYTLLVPLGKKWDSFKNGLSIRYSMYNI